MIQVADRIEGVEEYYFSKKLREIAQLRRSGKDILNLGIGSPDLPPAPRVIDKLQGLSDRDNVHGYQSYKGIPRLREAFSSWYKKYYAVTLHAEKEILPLIGSKEGIMHISMTYLNPGDEVLIPNPGYPAYAATARLTGALTRYYDLDESTHWQPNLEELAKKDLSKVKLMWINYPNMPTGTKATNTLFRDLKEFGETYEILICNDNPYSFILNKNPLSLLSQGLSEYTLELNSLSKSHNMAGWRVGMVAAKETHINNILKFKSNMDSGMYLPIQEAAVEALALNDDWYAEQNRIYESRREVVLEIMNALGCQYDSEQVGMFIWAKVPDNISDVKLWIDQILEEVEVFITPGFIFGEAGNNYIRISLCAKKDLFIEALSRIKRFKKRV